MDILDVESLVVADFDSELRLGGGDWEKCVDEKT